MLDAQWALMLSEGKGGFVDYGEYREKLTAIVWRGEMPELTPEQKAEAAKASVGQPTPEDVLAEARALYNAGKQHQGDTKK